MTEQWFDKSSGQADICENLVPPRVCLRTLGSFPALITIGCALIFGQLLWGAPIVGLILLGTVLLVYTLLQALFS